MNYRPFTSAGLSPDMTLGELEDQLAKLLKGRTSVHPLDVYQELTGLAHMSEWSELVLKDLLESVGLEDHGDGLYAPILPAWVIKSQTRRLH